MVVIMTTAEQYLLKEQLEIANFDISREINVRMRLKKAKYWLGRLEKRFPERGFFLDNLLVITDVPKELSQTIQESIDLHLDRREK